MTDKHDNANEEQPPDTAADDTPTADDEGNSGMRRRTVIAAALGSPALLGLGFGAADRFALPGPTMSASASPVEQAAAGVALQADMDPVAADVGEDPATDVPVNRYRVLHANEAVLDTLEREPGDQVRVTREDDTAVYSLAEPMGMEDNGMDDDETDNGIDDDEMDDDETDDEMDEETDENQVADAVVQASREGKCRLAFFEDMEFEDDRRWGPLRGDETCDLADQGFSVEIDPRVPTEDTDTETAAEDGELVETYVDGDTDIAVIAPHGGRMQPYTDQQAEMMLSEFPDITAWMLQGYGQNTSYYRWYVPSEALSVASYPGLAELSEETYDQAVSFNGISGDNIYVGGAADEGLRTEIVDAIDEALPHDGSPVMLGDRQYSADSPETLVNRITTDQSNGVWIGQPIADRRNHWDTIVEAVGSVFDE